MHLFLADDDRDELKIFLEAVVAADVMDNFKCTYATSGEQAIEMIKYLRPHFIFIDLVLPNGNGLDVLAAVKKMEHIKDIPFFIYSDEITEEVRLQAGALGASGCIEKTNLEEELSMIFRGVLQPKLAMAS